jgi:hypothetical protein
VLNTDVFTPRRTDAAAPAELALLNGAARAARYACDEPWLVDEPKSRVAGRASNNLSRPRFRPTRRRERGLGSISTTTLGAHTPVVLRAEHVQAGVSRRVAMRARKRTVAA